MGDSQFVWPKQVISMWNKLSIWVGQKILLDKPVSTIILVWVGTVGLNLSTIQNTSLLKKLNTYGVLCFGMTGAPPESEIIIFYYTYRFSSSRVNVDKVMERVLNAAITLSGRKFIWALQNIILNSSIGFELIQLTNIYNTL